MKKIISFILATALFVTMSSSALANEAPVTDETTSSDSHEIITEVLPPKAETFSLEPQEDKKIITAVETPLDTTNDNIETYGVPCGGAGGMHEFRYFSGHIHRIISSETCYYMTTQIASCAACSYETESEPTFVSAHPRYDPYCPNYNGGPIVG